MSNSLICLSMEYPHLTSLWAVCVCVCVCACVRVWVCGRSCHGDSVADGETAGSWYRLLRQTCRVSAGLSGSTERWCCGGSGGGGGGGGGSSWATGAHLKRLSENKSSSPALLAE